MGEVIPMQRKGGLTADELRRQHRAEQRREYRKRKAEMAAWRALPYREKVKFYRKKGVRV